MEKEIFFKRQLQQNEIDEIKRFVNNSPKAHIFQTLEWAKVNNSIASNACAYFWIRNENSIQFFALIQIFKHRFCNRFHGSISCGPVFNDIAVLREALPYLITKLKQNHFISFDLNPFWLNQDATVIEQIIIENNGQCIHAPGDYHFLSVAIDLSQNEDKIYSSFKNSSTRQMIQKAQKLQGIKVREGRDNDVQSFTDMYNSMMKSKSAKSRLSVKYMDSIFKNIIKEKRGFFLVQQYNDEPVAMAISLVCGETAVYTYGVSSEKYTEIPKGHLLQWELIKLAKSRNLRYYDMGGIDLGIDKDVNPSIYGVTQFKLGFSQNIVTTCRKHLIVLRKMTFNIFNKTL